MPGFQRNDRTLVEASHGKGRAFDKEPDKSKSNKKGIKITKNEALEKGQDGHGQRETGPRWGMIEEMSDGPGGHWIKERAR